VLVHIPVVPVAGYTGHIVDNRFSAPENAVEKCRLADIGSSYYGYNRSHQYPNSLSFAGFSLQSFETFTNSSRYTFWAKKRSISKRAAVPIFFSISPRLPMMIPF